MAADRHVLAAITAAGQFTPPMTARGRDILVRVRSNASRPVAVQCSLDDGGEWFNVGLAGHVRNRINNGWYRAGVPDYGLTLGAALGAADTSLTLAALPVDALRDGDTLTIGTETMTVDAGGIDLAARTVAVTRGGGAGHALGAAVGVTFPAVNVELAQ